MLPTRTPRLPCRARSFLARSAVLLACCVLGTSSSRGQQSQDVSTRDVAPTFKLQAQRNLVTVRVVVRNARGEVVSNLHQEDFQLFDRGKRQSIMQFSLEKPTFGAEPKPAAASSEKAPAAGSETLVTPPIFSVAPQRFIGLFVDDVNTQFGDLARARDAAQRYLENHFLPGDRVGLFTSSGQNQVDFTAELGPVRQALLKITPRPIMVEESCGAIPPYEAYLIVEMHDPTAINIATDEMTNCGQLTNPTPASTPSGINSQVDFAARRAEANGETGAVAALREIDSLVRHMATLPGQRNIVLISDGFLTQTQSGKLDELCNRALRSKVVINSLDARGLYVSSALADASRSGPAVSLRADIQAQKDMLLQESARQEGNTLGTLAFNTGGVFFENNNDLDEGFRRTSALPEAYYLLAFSPQNLKLDGSFHPLKVTLASGKGLTVQARKGYYAPSRLVDPAEQEKEEIQEAVYSQQETRALPVEAQTQFFMKTREDAEVDVLVHLDLHALQFRKAGDRNLDNLTFVAAAFDRDGHYVSGQQKALELRIRDATLEKYMRTGINIELDLDTRQGTYLVRVIVRDAGSGELSSLNRTVEIPY